jgi:type II secretory pathway predicted ATPase ExeA
VTEAPRYLKRTGILVGQPALNRQLRMGSFAALDQRLATRFTVRPMDLAESANYLRHHLALALGGA